MDPNKALDAIAEILNAEEWDSDTPCLIAEIIQATGREVSDVTD